MSVKKIVAEDNGTDEAVKSINNNNDNVTSSKRRRFDRCFSFMEEISIEPAGSTSSLKDIDSNKFKAEIKRWAKAVVAYARQVSGRFGSSRSHDYKIGGSSRGNSSRS